MNLRAEVGVGVRQGAPESDGAHGAGHPAWIINSRDSREAEVRERIPAKAGDERVGSLQSAVGNRRSARGAGRLLLLILLVLLILFIIIIFILLLLLLVLTKRSRSRMKIWIRNEITSKSESRSKSRAGVTGAQKRHRVSRALRLIAYSS